MLQYTSFCGGRANEGVAALIAVGLISIGIKHDGVILALHFTNFSYFTREAAGLSARMSLGWRREGIERIENKIYGCVAGAWKSPGVPFHVFQHSMQRVRLVKELGFVNARQKEPSSNGAKRYAGSEHSPCNNAKNDEGRQELQAPPFLYNGSDQNEEGNDWGGDKQIHHYEDRIDDDDE